MLHYIFRITVSIIFLMLISPVISNSQEVKGGDVKIVNPTNNKQDVELSSDSIQQKNDVSPLDIASDRGLFILSPDQMMQMRILGSVRAAFNYSDQVLLNKRTFNPYEIPTNVQEIYPNYFAGLSQTRIGFEVIRRTKKAGDVFIRIEADFANSVNSLRIRHAYGQVDHFLIGQTWSLFNNVSMQPATVSMSGPAGAIFIRTPQIRYFRAVNKIIWYVGIEYTTPDFSIPDSVNGVLFQVVPDFTGKISYSSGRFSGHFAAIATTMSGKGVSDKLSYTFGFGGSFAGKFEIDEKNNLYLSITSGRGISHYFDALRGKGEDAFYNAATKGPAVLFSTGGYVAYSREVVQNLSANLSFGMVAVSNNEFQPADAYSYSYSAMLNVFWQPIEGARVGLEYAFGQRYDIGGAQGNASKVSMLLYYDF